MADQLTHPSPPGSLVPVAGAPVAPGRQLGTVALLTVILGSFLPIFTFFLINVALPEIGADLQTSAGSLQLVVGCYGIAVAALVVVGGRLGDGYGRRRLFLLGLAGFAVTSLWCGLAPNIGVLLAGRVAQGVAAALLTPQVLAIITATLTGGNRARALGLFGASAGLAAALGLIVGGWLTSGDLAGTGWRAVFLINVPLALVTLAAAWWTVPESRAAKRLPIDPTGAGWLAVTLVVLLLPLTEGRPLGWPLWTWVLLVGVVPLAAGLGWHQARLERGRGVPLIPPSVLRLRGIRLGLAIGGVFFTTFVGFMFAFSLALQGSGGLSALETGLSILPMGLGFLYASIAGPRLAARWGSMVIARGGIIQAVGYAGAAGVTFLVWPEPSPLALAVPMAVIGVGAGLVMIPLFAVVLTQVPPQQAGLSSGILITMQQACLAFGAASVGTVYLATAETGWGEGNALVAVELLVVVASVGIALLGRRLRPRPVDGAGTSASA